MMMMKFKYSYFTDCTSICIFESEVFRYA